ncbi:hypothetical protein PR202_gb12123 [Eleusine coracana subsp. coracana]|uniref:Uncharacterized protein n=1 Tax=Eleusine coracana subsp. coracana TaxID=191504 RepID=A0AAV5EQ75_ELECO|nr:hypothetical protein PR202_gb12123 [Eleusine coracana subsp. coracana]
MHRFVMAEMVGSALVEEGVSRLVSFLWGKSEEKASQGHNKEMLELALIELEFVLERTGKLPITDFSLLQRRKMFQRTYMEGTDLLDEHRRQAPRGQEWEQGVKRKRWSTHVTSTVLNKDDVRRFQWFAGCARKFLKDVEYGCSLRQYTFCNPLVRHLLEGKILVFEMENRRQLRRFYMRPICLEGRGVEMILDYHYEDFKIPNKTFQLALLLRLSESTNIIGTAIKCLQSMASQFKIVTETAMEELSQMANLQYSSGRNLVTPSLEMTVGFLPHFVNEEQHFQESYAVEIIGDNAKRSDVSIQQAAETFSVLHLIVKVAT